MHGGKLILVFFQHDQLQFIIFHNVLEQQLFLHNVLEQQLFLIDDFLVQQFLEFQSFQRGSHQDDDLEQRFHK